MAIFKPNRIVCRVFDITPDMLRQMGVKGIVLDVDNTLSTHHAQQPLGGVAEWLDLMRAEGIGLVILSNARSSRVQPFAALLGLDFISLGLKPLPFGVNRAVRRLGLPKSQVILVGDQLFTDMLGANLTGVRGVLVEPAQAEYGWSFKLRRRAERPLIEKYKKDGAR
jgi:HAD superfamily phosphatase (TIGR01668 family)